MPNDTPLQQLLDQYTYEARHKTAAALDSIRDARRELDRLEENLKLAAAGQPYAWAGEVRGVSSQTVFHAFAAIECAATIRRTQDAEMGVSPKDGARA